MMRKFKAKLALFGCYVIGFGEYDLGIGFGA